MRQLHTNLAPPVAIAAVTAAMAFAGCGGSASSSPGSGGRPPFTTAQGDAAFIDFTGCMRSHHIAMADPVHRPGHTGLSLVLPAKGPATVRAYDACQHFIAKVVNFKEAHMRAIAQPNRLGLIRYAQCMRSHAIPMLDPDQYGILNLGNVPGINNGFGRYSPQFRAADHACRRLLPAGVRDNGSGP
jgi:hypothetical protein